MKISHPNPLVVIALLVGSSLYSQAGSITVPNGSFESPALTSGNLTTGYEGDSTSVTGWTIGGGSSDQSANSGVMNGGTPGYTPLDGSQVAYSNVNGNVSTLTDNAVTTIAANTTYTVTVRVANRSDGAANNGTYTVALTDNGQVVNPVTLAGSTIAPGTFTTMTATYTPVTTSVGHNLGIQLSFGSTTASASQGAYDQVLLTTSTGTNPSGYSFTFTLPGSYKTSAGVYDSTGKLVRTLWRGVTYTAGAHTSSWDGHDDKGNFIGTGTYTFKIAYHNMQYVWDGVVGNTSSSFNPGNGAPTSPRRGLDPTMCMAVYGTNGFETRGDNEAAAPQFAFNTATPQATTHSLGNIDNIYCLPWNFVATDGTKAYYASVNSLDTAAQTDTKPGMLVAYNVSDFSNYAFPAGAPFRNCPDWMTGYYGAYTWPNGVPVGTQPGIQGLAVQISGSYLATSVGPDNLVYLLDKTSGSVVKSFAVTNPRQLAFDSNGDLWVLTGTSAVRYTNLSTTPSIATTISGFSNPLAVAVHPTNPDIVLIADGGIKQQVKGYTHLGAVATGWSSALGTVGGNKLAGPAVTNTKFWFTGGNDIAGFGFLGEYTYLTINTDGSFWLGDNGNNRTLHFSSAKAYIEQIAWLPDTLQCSVDFNNPNRVFGGFLEYQVDYTKPLLPGDPYATGGNKSWKLVNNWAGGVPSQYYTFVNGPYNVVTLSNGHTYCWMAASYQPDAIFELTSTGLRNTGSTLAATLGGNFEIEADGSVRYSVISGGTATWYSVALTGFDASFNPQWASLPGTVLASAPAGVADPAPRGGGDGYRHYPISSSNVLLSFDNGTTNPGMHLGGVTVGSTSWLWEAAPAGVLDYLGTYDLSAQYAGNDCLGMDRTVLYGYNGEFGPGVESNQFMHFYDDGLFIGEFGTLGNVENATAGGAGNSFSLNLTKVSGEKYLWHNDESQHGGIHRWHLLGENGIQEASASGAAGSAITIAVPAATFPANTTGLAASGKAVLSWSPVSGATAYHVKYSTTRGGPYTVLSSTVTANTYSKTGLTNGTNYYFVVSAMVGGVESVNSNEVRIRPFDNTVIVQTAGYLYGGTSLGPTFFMSSSSPINGQPAISSVASDILGSLTTNSIGSQGFALYNEEYSPTTGWSNTTNIISPLTVTANSGWGLGRYSGYNFTVDGVSDYQDYAGYESLSVASSSGTIDITSPDGNWHYLTVFCPISFAGPESYTLTLVPQGLTSPAATFSAPNIYYNAWYQFLFKGNVTLTMSGSAGNLQGLFLDGANIAIAPVAPTGLTATAGTHQVSLTWTTTPNATSYNIYRGTSAGGESATAIATGVTLNNYVDTGLTTGTHYYYKIKAVNGVGTSAYSNEANASSL